MEVMEVMAAMAAMEATHPLDQAQFHHHQDLDQLQDQLFQ
jgi:hypothetical protein